MVGDATRLRFSELCAALPVQFMRVTLPSMTMDFEWAIRTLRSIQIGTPASASGPMPLLRSHGVVLSAMIRRSTPRRFAWIPGDKVLDLKDRVRSALGASRRVSKTPRNRF